MTLPDKGQEGIIPSMLIMMLLFRSISPLQIVPVTKISILLFFSSLSRPLSWITSARWTLLSKLLGFFFSISKKDKQYKVSQPFSGDSYHRNIITDWDNRSQKEAANICHHNFLRLLTELSTWSKTLNPQCKNILNWSDTRNCREVFSLWQVNIIYSTHRPAFIKSSWFYGWSF